MENLEIYNKLKEAYQEKEALLVSVGDKENKELSVSSDDELLLKLDQAAEQFQKAKSDYYAFLKQFIK